MTGVVQRLRWLGLLLLSFTCLTMGHAASLEKYDLDAQAPAAKTAGRTGVYSAVENGVTKYVGITDDIAARAAAHLRQKGIVINEHPDSQTLHGLTRGQWSKF